MKSNIIIIYLSQYLGSKLLVKVYYTVINSQVVSVPFYNIKYISYQATGSLWCAVLNRSEVSALLLESIAFWLFFLTDGKSCTYPLHIYDVRTVYRMSTYSTIGSLTPSRDNRHHPVPNSLGICHMACSHLVGCQK